MNANADELSDTYSGRERVEAGKVRLADGEYEILYM